MSHRCPGAGCRADVSSSQLACKKHWFQLPKELRDNLWNAMRRHGQLSDEHVGAIQACTDWYRDNTPPSLPGMP